MIKLRNDLTYCAIEQTMKESIRQRRIEEFLSKSNMLRSWREERDAKEKEEEALANRSMNNIIKKYNKI